LVFSAVYLGMALGRWYPVRRRRWILIADDEGSLSRAMFRRMYYYVEIAG
jgi:hypothetical protein